MLRVLASAFLAVPVFAVDPAKRAEEPPPRVAIAQLETSAAYLRDMVVFGNALAARLSACGRFEVLERRVVDEALDSLGIRRPFKAKDLARLGTELGADLVLGGRVFTNARGGWSMSMSVVDAAKGRQRWVLKVNCEGCASGNEGVDKMMAERLAEDLVKKRLPKARVCPTQ